MESRSVSCGAIWSWLSVRLEADLGDPISLLNGHVCFATPIRTQNAPKDPRQIRPRLSSSPRGAVRQAEFEHLPVQGTASHAELEMRLRRFGAGDRDPAMKAQPYH